MNDAPELDLLTKREVADLLKVSEVTVARWLKQGRLPAYRVGPRAIRVRRADVERLMAPLNGTSQTSAPQEDWKAEALRPLTEEEREQGLRWAAEAKRLSDEVLARRGGKPFTPSSAEIIREEREKRTKQIDDAIGHRGRNYRPLNTRLADSDDRTSE